MGFLGKLFGKKREDDNESVEVLDAQTLNEEPVSEASENEEAFELLDESDFESLDDEIDTPVIEEDAAETEETEEAVTESEETRDGEAEEAVEEIPVLTEETRKEEKKSFWSRVKQSLSKTKNALFSPIDDLLKSFVKVDEDLLEELEEVLICADIGVNATGEIIEELRDRIKSGRLKEKE
jgi:fused signal recognition particle receptor